MSDKIFLDSNILCYAADKNADEKHCVCRRIFDELLSSHRGYISTQVLQETYSVITRKLKFPQDDARQFIDSVCLLEVHENSVKDVREAIDLHIKQQLSFWDALIVIAARNSGCSTLYTEDLNAGQEILGVTIINPLSTKEH